MRVYRSGAGPFPVAGPAAREDADGVCLGIPAQIVGDVDPETKLARAEISGVRRDVSVALCPEAGPGDWVLVHVGFALAAIDEARARETIALLERLGDAYEQEVRELEAGTT
jgi:hydrogenase expression/formation protein HypC